MNILKSVRKTVRGILEIVDGGDTCILCGRESFLLPLCHECAEKIQKIDFSAKRCEKCGKILFSEIEICRDCRENGKNFAFDSIFPILPYRNQKKSLLFEWKMRDNRMLSPLFASIIDNVLREKGWQDFPIVPVPPRPGKIRRKGWDQIDELAYFLHTNFHRKILKILVRTSRAEQKRLSALERLGNSRAGFSLKRNAHRILPSEKKAAVLIDDIETTGATLDSCARLLKNAGFELVFAVTLFSAR